MNPVEIEEAGFQLGKGNSGRTEADARTGAVIAEGHDAPPGKAVFLIEEPGSYGRVIGHVGRARANIPV